MLYMVISKTRKDLTAEEFARLGELAKDFYANIPEGVTLHSDWGALDGSCTFALMETEQADLLEEIQKPFIQYVDIATKEVKELSGWGK